MKCQDEPRRPGRPDWDRSDNPHCEMPNFRERSNTLTEGTTRARYQPASGVTRVAVNDSSLAAANTFGHQTCPAAVSARRIIDLARSLAHTAGIFACSRCSRFGIVARVQNRIFVVVGHVVLPTAIEQREARTQVLFV